MLSGARSDPTPARPTHSYTVGWLPSLGLPPGSSERARGADTCSSRLRQAAALVAGAAAAATQRGARGRSARAARRGSAVRSDGSDMSAKMQAAGEMECVAAVLFWRDARGAAGVRRDGGGDERRPAAAPPRVSTGVSGLRARVPRDYNNRASRTSRNASRTTPSHNLSLKCGAFRFRSASSRCSYLPRPHLLTSHARQHGRLVVGRTGTRAAAAPLDPVARRLGLRGQPLLHLSPAAARLGRRRVQHDTAECVVCQSGMSGSERVRRSCDA